MTDHTTGASTGHTTEHTTGTSTGAKHTAGAFDIRNIIGALIGLYGLVLTVMGIVGDPEKNKTGQMPGNANLWAGIVMLVVGVAFIAWARLRPIVVPVHDEPGSGDDATGTGSRSHGH